MEAAGTTEASAGKELQPHVAIVSSPGMSLLIPIAALGRTLAVSHGFEVTFLLTDPNPAAVAYLSSFPEGTHVETLPIDMDDVPSTVHPLTRFFLTTSRSLPLLRDALSRISNLAAVVVDHFCTDVFEVAREAGAAPYMFFTGNANTLSVLLHLPELDQKIQGEYRDMSEPLRLPGCVEVEGRDLPQPFHDRSNDAYKGVLRQCRNYPLAEGIIINTFEGIEAERLKALQDRVILANTPPVYAVGPLIAQPDGTVDRETCPSLRWLDRQPAGSVLFISFGSGGTLTVEQMAELAAGLEMSGQRFLWVARPPSGTAHAAYFTSSTGSNVADDPLWFLPPGFVDRTREAGLVVSGWAPQVAVLAHEATGGFLTHCGWSSVLEAMIYGLPLIAWPLYAEQKMNAVMLANEIGVAIRPSVNGSLVMREEVCRAVKALMEGDEGKKLKRTADVIRKAAESTLAEGGASAQTLAHVADMWRTAATKTAAAAPSKAV